MLRSLRRRAILLVGEERLALAPLPGYLSRGPRQSELRRLAHSDKDTVEHNLGSVLKVLLEERGDIGAVHVVLDDAFVRYLVIPWSPHLTHPSEALALASAQFAEVFGEDPVARTIRLDMRRFGENGIACAVGTDLLNQLVHECSRARVTLLSIQPRFLSSLKRHRKKLPKDLMFISVFGRCCVIGIIADDMWRDVRKVRIGKRAESIVEVILRERMLQGLPPELPLYLHGCSEEVSTALRGAGINASMAMVKN